MKERVDEVQVAEDEEGLILFQSKLGLVEAGVKDEDTLPYKPQIALTIAYKP